MSNPRRIAAAQGAEPDRRRRGLEHLNFVLEICFRSTREALDGRSSGLGFRARGSRGCRLVLVADIRCVCVRLLFDKGCGNIAAEHLRRTRVYRFRDNPGVGGDPKIPLKPEQVAMFRRLRRLALEE
jgi:hypothetical protein